MEQPIVYLRKWIPGTPASCTFHEACTPARMALLMKELLKAKNALKTKTMKTMKTTKRRQKNSKQVCRSSSSYRRGRKSTFIKRGILVQFLTDCRFHFDVNTASISVDSLLNKDFTKGKEDDVLVLNALFSQLQEKTMHLKPWQARKEDPRAAVDAAVLFEKTTVPAVGGGYLLVPAMAEKKEKEKDDEPKDESNKSKPKDEPKDEPKEEEEEDEEEDEWIDLSDMSLEENSMSMTMAATTPPTSEKEEDEKEDFLDFW